MKMVINLQSFQKTTMPTAHKYGGQGKIQNLNKPVNKQQAKLETRDAKLVFTPAPKKPKGNIVSISFYFEDETVQIVKPHHSFLPQHLEGLGESLNRGKVVNSIVTRA